MDKLSQLVSDLEKASGTPIALLLLVAYLACTAGLFLKYVISNSHLPGRQVIGIVGMRLRGNPPMLLIDAFIKLRKIPVDTSIQEVEVVYIRNKTQASTSDALVKLVQEHRENQDR